MRSAQRAAAGPRKRPSASVRWTNCAGRTATTARGGPAAGLWRRITGRQRPGRPCRTNPYRAVLTSRPSRGGPHSRIRFCGRSFPARNCLKSPLRQLPTKGCPNCGTGIFKYSGFYPWVRNHHPCDFKSVCPQLRLGLSEQRPGGRRLHLGRKSRRRVRLFRRRRPHLPLRRHLSPGPMPQLQFRSPPR